MEELKTFLPVVFLAWAIRRHAGQDLEHQTCEQNKAKLKEFVEQINDPRLVLLQYVEKGAVEMFKNEPEGIVAKLKTSTYIPMSEGSSKDRVKYWIKLKHTHIRKP